MQIRELYAGGKPVISFEIFPPRQESGPDAVTDVLSRMASLNPGFISVTYGAGGTGNHALTGRIAHLIKTLGAEPMAHLTASGSRKQELEKMLSFLKEKGIENIMALRGDPPSGGDRESAAAGAFSGSGTDGGEFPHASDLIRWIKSRGDFCCGAACYPEIHIDCPTMEENLEHTFLKQEAGADFFISQLFFENDKFFRFAEKAAARGITAPLAAGIMPILGKSQIQRMIFQCGVSLPSEIVRILHKYEHSPRDLQKAGIDHACRQAEALFRHGHRFIHIYSMNKPEIAEACTSVFRQLCGL